MCNPGQQEKEKGGVRQSFPLITTFSFIFVFSFLTMLSTLPKSFPITSKGIEDQSTGHHLIQVKRWASGPVYLIGPCADLCSKPALWSAMQGEVVQVLILHLHFGLKMALPKAYEIIDCDYHFSSGRVWTWCRGGSTQNSGSCTLSGVTSGRHSACWLTTK